MQKPPLPEMEGEDGEDGEGPDWVPVDIQVVAGWRKLSLAGSASSESLEELVAPSREAWRMRRSASVGNLGELAGSYGSPPSTSLRGLSLDGGASGAAALQSTQQLQQQQAGSIGRCGADAPLPASAAAARQRRAVALRLTVCGVLLRRDAP